MRRWWRLIDNDLGRMGLMIRWNRTVPAFVGARQAVMFLASDETASRSAASR